MKGKEEITILHLSDLHFTADAMFRNEVRSWYDSLHADIASCLKDRPKANTFIVVAGDLTVSGQPKEFENAGSFLQSLLESLNLSKSHLVLVPGNHDVAWNKPSQYGRAAFFDCARQFAPDQEDLHSPLRRFAEKGVVFLTPGKTRISSQTDASRVWNAIQSQLGTPQYTNDLRIAVTHYPFHGDAETKDCDQTDPWWAESIFQREVRRSGPHLILHGHVHNVLSESFPKPLGHRPVAVGAGPLSSEKWRRASSGPPVYHVMFVSHDRLQVRTRVYVTQSQRWVDRGSLFARLDWMERGAQRHLRPAEGNRKEQAALMDRLCELSEYDIAVLTKDLGAAIGEYVPLKESREEFARRLVNYFCEEKSLDYLEGCMSRLQEAEITRRIRIFISATRQGKKVAKAVAMLCKSFGAQAWTAEQDLSPGHDTMSEIVRAIGQADIFLVIVSADFQKSRWISEEVSVALQHGEGRGPRVIPMLLKGGVLPDVLQGLQAIRVDDEDKIESGVLAKVLGSIE